MPDQVKDSVSTKDASEQDLRQAFKRLVDVAMKHRDAWNRFCADPGAHLDGAPLALVRGGTGATTAGDARTNLGVAYASVAETIAGVEAGKVTTPDGIAGLWEASADFTDGSTVTLGDGGYFELTSSATITLFVFTSSKAGRRALVRFGLARVIDENASIQVPGGANIAVAAGSLAEVVDLGGGVVQVVVPQPASDTVAGSMEIAVQSEQEAGSDTVRAVTPGRQHFHQSASKFWAKVDGDGVGIDASYNVASIDDDGAGRIGVNYTTAFSSANYAVTVTCERPNTTMTETSLKTTAVRSATQATGSCDFECWDNTEDTSVLEDPAKWHVSGFGDL